MARRQYSPRNWRACTRTRRIDSSRPPRSAIRPFSCRLTIACLPAAAVSPCRMRGCDAEFMNYRAFHKLALLSLLYWAPLCPGWPQSAVSEDFDTIAESLFWDELHPYGGGALFLR